MYYNPKSEEVQAGRKALEKEFKNGNASAFSLEVGNLNERLETRKLIDRAKGILMQALNLSEPEAFSWIQRAAMDRRLTMKVVARAVIDPTAKID